TYGGLGVRLQVPTYPHLWRPERSRHAAFNAVCSALNRSVTGRMTDGTQDVRRTIACVRRCAARHIPSNNDGERFSSSYPSRSRSSRSGQSKAPVFRCNKSPEVFTH
uniref:Uncharacterized protein n=1 Tax=Oryza glaberrima TaxID=4538 RepID=I1QE00_ORYGL